MSSTTRADRGQTLVLFALSLGVILSFAALAFDVGQVLLAKRSQQDAADAAALAGARYIAAAGCKSNPALSNSACAPAISAALKVAQANGYGDGTTNCVSGCTSVNPKVIVKIPPGPEAPEFNGAAGVIEVQIGSNHPSIFAGVLGITNWNVGTTAVAANQVDIALNYSMLALSPTCPSVSVSGSGGTLVVGGNIQVDATCAGGLSVGNNGSIDVTSGACNVSGPSIATGHGSYLGCTRNYNVPVVPDPLVGLAAPTIPPVAQPPVDLDNTTGTPPTGCMSTLAAPVTCSFPNSNAYKDSHWRLYPGTYPGGLSIRAAATFYMQPGIYYLAGGGLQINGGGGGNPTVISVSDGTTTLGGGVLIYNTSDTSAGTTVLAGGSINLNGASATVQLLPYQSDPYQGMVIFQDRTLNSTIVLNGSSSNLNVVGTIYAPLAQVQVNGSNSTAMNSQIIAYSFLVTGSGGSLTTGYDAGSFFHIRGSGLVQ